MGQTRPSDRNRARSVHSLIADLRRQHRHVGFVPKAEMILTSKTYDCPPKADMH